MLKLNQYTATTQMKNIVIAAVALAFVISSVQAQDGKVAKKAAVVEAKGQVAADKAELKLNKEARKADKASGNKEALKADRKARMKGEAKLVKDEAKKDVKIVKEKL